MRTWCRHRGVTLVELTIAGGLFLVLTGLLLAGLSRGVQSWMLGDERSSLLDEAQSLVDDISWELESSHLGGVDIQEEPGIFTFISPFGTRESTDRNEISVDASSGLLRWAKYVVVYHDVAASKLYKVELPISSGSSATASPQPLSAVDIGFGIRPLSHYAADGREVASKVEHFSATRSSRSVELVVGVRNERDQEFSYSTAILVRN